MSSQGMNAAKIILVIIIAGLGGLAYAWFYVTLPRKLGWVKYILVLLLIVILLGGTIHLLTPK